MKTKKLFALTIALAAALSLTGCGGSSGGGGEKKAELPKKSVPPIVEMGIAGKQCPFVVTLQNC